MITEERALDKSRAEPQRAELKSVGTHRCGAQSASYVKLVLNRMSDHVCAVKPCSSTLHLGLGEERLFALVEGFAFPTVVPLVIGVRNSVRPVHPFGHNLDHDY
jgi:hypothetical protein